MISVYNRPRKAVKTRADDFDWKTLSKICNILERVLLLYDKDYDTHYNLHD